MGPDGPISIVHRDLKPENIFVANVAGEQVIKILDFGIGKAKSVASQVAGRASQSHSQLTSFTPAYGAPEQWVPKRFGQTGPWTDVWGLALTTVEVLAARPIIDGDQAAMMGTVLDPARRPTPRTEGLVVSDEVEAVFARALALDPRDRYADAGAFWNDLLPAAGIDERAIGSRSSRAPLRDERSEGGVVPRVETIEAAMPERTSRISGMQPRVTPGQREAATLDAAMVAGVGGQQGGVGVRGGVSRRDLRQRPSPALEAIPDLAFDKPPPPQSSSSASMPAFSGRRRLRRGARRRLEWISRWIWRPAKSRRRRLSSSSMRAVSVPPSAPASRQSGAGCPQPRPLGGRRRIRPRASSGSS